MDHPGPIESHKRELVAGDIPTKEDDAAPVVLYIYHPRQSGGIKGLAQGLKKAKMW